MSYALTFASTNPLVYPFPFMADAVLDHSVMIESPTDGVLPRGTVQEFNIELPGATEAALVTSPCGQWTSVPLRGSRSIAALKYDVPIEAESVVLQARFGGEWIYLLEYVVQ